MKPARDRLSDVRPNPVTAALSHALGILRADSDMLALLQAHESLGPMAIEKLDVQDARRNPTFADAMRLLLVEQGRSVDPETLYIGVSSHDITVDGAAGTLPARVYTPRGAGPFPLVLYFHGGGWVLADKDVYDGGARGIANHAGAVVVSVDYRQAPEHRFPAAWDDALAAYRWISAHAPELQGDASRVALAGESAGGNLAIATAIAARDAGLAPPVHVLAIYPVTQTSTSTASYIENAIAKPLNRAMILWFVDKLVRSESDLQDARLQLVDAPLRGLPSVTLISARIDPLRNDSVKMKDALEKAGVPVELKEYDGVTHEFFGAAAVVEKARHAQTYAGLRLSAAFDAADSL